MVHSLKFRHEYFEEIRHGTKMFEIRRLDRDYRVGDLLALNEIDNEGKYTGHHLLVGIMYIFSDEEFCKPGYAVLGIEQNSCCSMPTLMFNRGKAPDIPGKVAEERQRIPVTKEQMEQMADLCLRNSCVNCMLGPLGCNWEEDKSTRTSLSRVFEIKED